MSGNPDARSAVAEVERLLRTRPVPPLFTAREIEDVLTELREAFGNPPDAELLRLFRAFEIGYVQNTLDEMHRRGEVRFRRSAWGLRTWELAR